MLNLDVKQSHHQMKVNCVTCASLCVSISFSLMVEEALFMRSKTSACLELLSFRWDSFQLDSYSCVFEIMHNVVSTVKDL